MTRRIALFLTVLILCVTDISAQLCQGSLGDPIVNITFGSGNNPGAQLQAAGLGYQHVIVDCPNDGQYAVRNRTENCFGGWHTLTSDHTGNTNGYFMLVNASFQPSDFFLDTVDLFCSNTTYEFAAWVMNMMKTTTCGGGSTINPNLTFSIERTDGTIIETYNSGTIPVSSVATWNQYGFFFNAPPGVNRVVLRITNNAPGGCGNDLALDDITFRPCGPLINATFDNNSNSLDLCEGASGAHHLSATISSGFNNPVYQWQQNINGGGWIDIPGANLNSMDVHFNPSFTPGIYQYRLSVVSAENSAVSICRVSSAPLTINVHPNPVVSLQSNSPVCANNTLTIQASGGTGFQWSGPNSFSSTAPTINLSSAQPHSSGNYSVTVTSDKGCVSQGSISVVVNPTPAATVVPAEATICEGGSVVLTGSGGSIYEWRPATGLSSSSIASPTASPGDSTEYQLIVSNAFLCADTVYSRVHVIKKPVADAGPDRELFQGQTVTLAGAVAGTDINYVWTPDFAINDVNLLQPLVNPVADTSYILTASSNAGCGTASDTVLVKVFKGIFIPTAFTPNGDGLNDDWRIPGLGIYKDHEVMVFNRYGQVIFTTKNNRPWDGTYRGKEQPVGSYPYLVRIREGNILLKGTVILVR